METEFNTGRGYTADGQIIKCKVEGNTVRFYDTSRMIIGSFPLAPGVHVHSLERLKAMVMAQYDSGNYTCCSNY